MPASVKATSGPTRKAARQQEQAAAGGRVPTAFGRLIKEMRSARGISQAALARQASISAGYVGLIETGDRGERPSLEIVKKFAQCLGANVEETEELLRAAGHLGAGESLYPTDATTFTDFVRNYKRFTTLQKDILFALVESWGMKDV